MGLQLNMKKICKEGCINVIAVRDSDQWGKCLKNDSIYFVVQDYNEEEVFRQKYFFKRESESVSEFINRCKKNNIWNGIVIIDSQETLQDIVDISTIISTSIGIEGLDTLLGQIVKLDHFHNKAIYAFENKPDAIQGLKNKHGFNSYGKELIHCPVDRVVTDRWFSDSNDTMYVRLGLDQSQVIMIHDKYCEWGTVVNPENDSNVIITEDCSKMHRYLLVKHGCKNVVHKVACNHAVRNITYTTINDISNESLKNLIQAYKLLTTEYMMKLKDTIVTMTLVKILSQEYYSEDKIISEYHELSSYYDNSLYTVTNDISDSVGRIIHMESYSAMEHDRDMLINSLYSYEKHMRTSDAHKILICLEDKLSLSKEEISENIGNMIKDLENT